MNTIINYTEQILFIQKEDENFVKFIVHDHQRYDINNKIRGAIVGYQYDCNNRYYPKEKIQVPNPIQEISQRAYIISYNCKIIIKMILNLNQDSPIYSFSFGLSSVFVIEGPTKDEKLIAIKLDLGDLLVMSGHARRYYNGFPKVIANQRVQYLQLEIHFNNPQPDDNFNNDFMFLITQLNLELILILDKYTNQCKNNEVYLCLKFWMDQKYNYQWKHLFEYLYFYKLINFCQHLTQKLTVIYLWIKYLINLHKMICFFKESWYIDTIIVIIKQVINY